MPIDLSASASFLALIGGSEPPIVDVVVGESWFRLMERKFPDLLGHGPGSSRFSDPGPARPGSAAFDVIYGARDLATAFEEVVLRDTTDEKLAPHERPLSHLRKWHGGFFRVVERMRVVDLTTSGGLRKIGVPTDIVRFSSHARSQVWARAFHDHRHGFDGIRYRSRFTGELNLAVFDRAIAKLRPGPIHPLLDYDIDPILRRLHVRVV